MREDRSDVRVGVPSGAVGAVGEIAREERVRPATWVALPALRKMSWRMLGTWIGMTGFWIHEVAQVCSSQSEDWLAAWIQSQTARASCQK